MATSKIKNNFSKMQSYATESLEKIRSKSWASPTAVALGATATILEKYGKDIPGSGIIGGALKLGSTLLNPSPTLSDLKKQGREIEARLESSDAFVKDIYEIDGSHLEQECQQEGNNY